MTLLAFLEFLLLKRGSEHDTVGIFATFNTKKGPDNAENQHNAQNLKIDPLPDT
jgi:hypothetical protein